MNAGAPRDAGSLTVLSFASQDVRGTDALVRLTGRWSRAAPAAADVTLVVGQAVFAPLDGSVGTTRSKRHGVRWRAAFGVPDELLGAAAAWVLVVAGEQHALPQPRANEVEDDAGPPVPPATAAPPETEDEVAVEIAALSRERDALAAALEAERARSRALEDALAEAERQLDLRALDGPDQPVFTLPVRTTTGPGAAILAVGAAFVAVAGALAALQIGVLAPDALVVLLLGAAAGLALLSRPEWLIPVFLGIMWTSVGGRFFAGFPSPIEIGGVILLPVAGWFALSRLHFAREVVLVFGLLCVPVVATGLVAPGGVAFGPDRIKDLLFLVVCALCLRGSDSVERVFVVLAGTVAFLGLGAVFSVVVGPTELFPLNEEPTSDQAARAAGPFGESNFFALSLAATVPLLLHLTVRGGWRSWLGAAALLCAVAGIFAAGSRGGLVAAGAGTVAFGVVTGGRARWAAAAAVLVAALMLPVFAAQAQSSSNRKVSGRLTENMIAVAMFADHPVTGVGPQQYPTYYRDYTREVGDDPRYEREAHSLPLQIAAEQGVAGIVGWVGALLALAQFVRTRRLWADPTARAVVLCIATFGVGSLFLHGSQLRLLYALFGLLLACGAAQRRWSRPAALA